MGFVDRAKAASDSAAQKAALLREQAAGVAANVAEKATAIGEQTSGLATDLRDRAGTIGEALADAALDRAEAAMNDFNATLPILRRAGYTVSAASVQLGVPPKISASFVRSEAVTDAAVEAMLAENADFKLATMLVRAIVRAHKLQDAVVIGGLQAQGISIDIGLSPSVSIKFGR